MQKEAKGGEESSQHEMCKEVDSTFNPKGSTSLALTYLTYFSHCVMYSVFMFQSD